MPIASAKEDESLLQKAFDRIDEELEHGNVVCIYPEGGITQDGNIHSFRGGVEKIIERRHVPAIAVGISGLWGSWFSRKKGGGLRRIPGRLFARVNIRIGEPVPPPQATADGLQMLVRTLRGDRR